MHHIGFWDYAGNYPIKWVALNIPYNTFGKNGLEGDIDMLYSLSKPPVPNPNYHPDYIRAFEVKTATVNGNGAIKSFDNDKFEYGFEQCQKLEKFGAEMIFLLDFIILEQGKKITYQDTWKRISNKIEARMKKCATSNYGYNVKFFQYIEGCDEYSVGIAFPPRDYVHGKHLPKGESFKIFTDKLNEVAQTYPFRNGMRILYFCKKCRNIAATSSADRNPQCNHCGNVIPVHE